MPNDTLPDWEQVLSSAARLQRILPEAILVGGTAAALYAEHRLSTDANHVLPDLQQRFDQVLAELESVAGWKTACTNEESALQQLQIQLAHPLPYDLEELGLDEYKNLDPRWQNWGTVKTACARHAMLIFDRIVGLE